MEELILNRDTIIMSNNMNEYDRKKLEQFKYYNKKTEITISKHCFYHPIIGYKNIIDFDSGSREDGYNNACFLLSLLAFINNSKIEEVQKIISEKYGEYLDKTTNRLSLINFINLLQQKIKIKQDFTREIQTMENNETYVINFANKMREKIITKKSRIIILKKEIAEKIRRNADIKSDLIILENELSNYIYSYDNDDEKKKSYMDRLLKEKEYDVKTVNAYNEAMTILEKYNIRQKDTISDEIMKELSQISNFTQIFKGCFEHKIDELYNEFITTKKIMVLKRKFNMLYEDEDDDEIAKKNLYRRMSILQVSERYTKKKSSCHQSSNINYFYMYEDPSLNEYPSLEQIFHKAYTELHLDNCEKYANNHLVEIIYENGIYYYITRCTYPSPPCDIFLSPLKQIGIEDASIRMKFEAASAREGAEARIFAVREFLESINCAVAYFKKLDDESKEANIIVLSQFQGSNREGKFIIPIHHYDDFHFEYIKNVPIRKILKIEEYKHCNIILMDKYFDLEIVASSNNNHTQAQEYIFDRYVKYQEDNFKFKKDTDLIEQDLIELNTLNDIYVGNSYNDNKIFVSSIKISDKLTKYELKGIYSRINNYINNINEFILYLKNSQNKILKLYYRNPYEGEENNKQFIPYRKYVYIDADKYDEITVGITTKLNENNKIIKCIERRNSAITILNQIKTLIRDKQYDIMYPSMDSEIISINKLQHYILQKEIGYSLPYINNDLQSDYENCSLYLLKLYEKIEENNKYYKYLIEKINKTNISKELYYLLLLCSQIRTNILKYNNYLTYSQVICSSKYMT